MNSFIRQKHSKARLSVTESALKCLLSKLQVFSSYANILTSFTIGEGNPSEGRSGFYSSAIGDMYSAHVDQTGIELCYLLKYVEFDVGSSSPALWCVRKMAVYQKVNMRSQETKCILIQSSADVQRRKEEVAQSLQACEDLSEHWTSLHLLLLGTLTRNWTTYLKYLDISVEHLHSSLHSSTVPKITITDLQNASTLADLLLRSTHVLKLNMEVFKALSRETKRAEDIDSPDSYSRYRTLEWAIDSTMSETKLLRDHVDLVLNRAKGIQAMMRDLISIRETESMQDLVRNTRQVTIKPEESTSSTLVDFRRIPIRDISQEPPVVREPKSTKTITLVMLLYLPLIFTSTFLSMGFIHVTSSHGGLIVVADDDMYFYLALTLPLLMVTIGGWYLWECRARRQRRISDTEENVKLE
ncbi:hypothetical protein BDZ45DRAFT_38140 [Acephala macrosclerotiorum]|nr:hypothetical protein BDZ45DRAFT_38140 [Acephala macrosclerotiorum]